MSFSFSSLIRLLVLLALGSTMLAVGLSRLDPPGPGWRSRRTPRDFNVNECFLDVTDRTPRWLDSETGRVVSAPLADGDVLEVASSSPWVDEHGHRQVVGRWSSRTKDGPMSMSHDFGLARYTFPGGEKLDQVSTEIVPVGPPCWFPGTRARVLFAAGDGELYRYAFEAEDRQKSDPERDPRPSPIAWRCPKPGQGEVFLGDLTWPDDPRLGGCVVASLRLQGPDGRGGRVYSRTQLWWLKLNHAGTHIVDAGRLIVPEPGADDDGYDERSPSLATRSDGRLALAYLHHRGEIRGWELRVAPVSIDAERHVPSALQSAFRVLAPGCQAAPAAFSPDGRWLTAIVGAHPSVARMKRLATDAAFPAPAPAHLAASP